MNIKYRKRVLLVIGLLAISIDLHITCFNHIMQDVFRYYADGYKLIVFFVEYWVVSSSAYLINIEDSKKLRFYVKPKFRFFGCIPGSEFAIITELPRVGSHRPGTTP